jgi:hypothetical protein
MSDPVSGFDRIRYRYRIHDTDVIDKFVLFSAQYIWETKNKGKLWKDIRGKYETAEE